MSGNGKEPKEMQKEAQKMPQIEQMRILYDHVHASYRLLETLMYDERIDNGEVTWRVNSLTGIMLIADYEIWNAIVMMESEMEDENVPTMQNAPSSD